MICPKCNKDYLYLYKQNLFCYNCDTLWIEKENEK